MSPYRVPAERTRTGGRRLSLWPETVIMGAAIAFCVAACSLFSPAKTTKAPDPRAVATQTATLLGDAWMTSATSCLAFAKAQPDVASKNKARLACDAALSPVHDSILLLDAAVDSWTDASQKNYPCLVRDVINGLDAAQLVFGPAPQDVQDALKIATSYAGACS